MKKTAFILLVLVVMGFGSSVFANPAAGESLTLDQKRELDITQGSQKIRRQGKLPLFFADAQDGKPLKGVAVTVQDVGQFQTDKNGFVSLPKLDNGNYSMTVAKEGYISEELEFKVRAGFVTNYRFNLTKELKGEYLRIVLAWGNSPADLDLHLEQEDGYHISYWNMHNAADGSVMLDRDDMNQYGPETITIMEYNPKKVYRLYIADYTNRNSGTSTALSTSSAVVRVYSKDSQLAEYAVPQDVAGNRWNVFTLDNGTIVDDNTIEVKLTNY